MQIAAGTPDEQEEVLVEIQSVSLLEEMARLKERNWKTEISRNRLDLVAERLRSTGFIQTFSPHFQNSVTLGVIQNGRDFEEAARNAEIPRDVLSRKFYKGIPMEEVLDDPGALHLYIDDGENLGGFVTFYTGRTTEGVVVFEDRLLTSRRDHSLNGHVDPHQRRAKAISVLALEELGLINGGFVRLPYSEPIRYRGRLVALSVVKEGRENSPKNSIEDFYLGNNPTPTDRFIDHIVCYPIHAPAIDFLR